MVHVPTILELVIVRPVLSSLVMIGLADCCLKAPDAGRPGALDPAGADVCLPLGGYDAS